MKRPGGIMTQELFEKIIREGMEMGVRHFIPFLNGEPLLFPKFWDWMTYMRDRGITTDIFTNASMLTREAANRFNEYPNINVLIMSFHGGNKETYEKVMGLPFDRAVENCHYMFEVTKIPMVKTYMTRFSATDASIADFQALWGNRGYVGSYFNYAGQRPDAFAAQFETRKEPCQRVLHHMTILWDGRVGLCCMDNEGDVVLGDANTQHLRDIWEGPVSTKYKDHHNALNFDLPLCSVCNMNNYA
jgi:hypothetical protein